MDYLNLGTIINVHGIKGEVVIKSNTYFANERYKKENNIILISPDSKKEIIVHALNYYQYKGNDYVLFEEINNVDDALNLKGYSVNIKKNDVTLKENQYFFNDLEGCKIITLEGKYLGDVIKVEEFPAQITLRCKTNNNKIFFVPFIDKIFIQEVDIKNKTIIIKYMEGMLWKIS